MQVKQLSIYTQLANRYNLPYQVVEVICNSPFRFIKDKMKDCDPKACMLAYLFKIKLKKRYNGKEDTHS